MFLSGYIAYKNDLTVGILTFEDYYLYDYEFNKPYTKSVAMSIGMFLGIIYLKLVEYKQKNEEQRKTKHSWIHFMKTYKFVGLMLYIYGGSSMLFITSVPLTANQNSYSWTKTQNVTYYIFGRFCYISGVAAIILAIFLGSGSLIRRLLGQPLWWPLSRLTFGAYLLYPIAISLTCYNSDIPVYISYPYFIYQFISNIAVAYMLSLFLFILFEAPVQNIVQLCRTLMTARGKAIVQDGTTTAAATATATATGISEEKTVMKQTKAYKMLEEIAEDSEDIGKEKR